jgi:hypothetical protein
MAATVRAISMATSATAKPDSMASVVMISSMRVAAMACS